VACRAAHRVTCGYHRRGFLLARGPGADLTAAHHRTARRSADISSVSTLRSIRGVPGISASHSCVGRPTTTSVDRCAGRTVDGTFGVSGHGAALRTPARRRGCGCCLQILLLAVVGTGSLLRAVWRRLR